MPLRRLIVLSSLVLCLAALSPATALGAAKGTDRPLRGTLSSTTTINIATLVGTAEETAQLSHFGRGTLHLDFTVTPTGANTLTVAGAGTIVAANGDQAFVTFTGTGTLTGLTVGSTSESTLVFAITGGTGRFADASGTFTEKSTAKIVSLVGTTATIQETNTVQGRISY